MIRVDPCNLKLVSHIIRRIIYSARGALKFIWQYQVDGVIFQDIPRVFHRDFQRTYSPRLTLNHSIHESTDSGQKIQVKSGKYSNHLHVVNISGLHCTRLSITLYCNRVKKIVPLETSAIFRLHECRFGYNNVDGIG